MTLQEVRQMKGIIRSTYTHAANACMHCNVVFRLDSSASGHPVSQLLFITLQARLTSPIMLHTFMFVDLFLAALSSVRGAAW